MNGGYFGYLAGIIGMQQDYSQEIELVEDPAMASMSGGPWTLKTKKPEPIILTTDPDQVMWNSLLFAVALSMFAFLLTYAI
jgi:hypothetical protein